MFSRFFINRPIFAAVVSIVIVLAGAITLFSLPVAQYPLIEPPTVVVQASYPGASARVVADTVGAPIEQQVNGVEGMIYMSSNSSSDGSYVLTITFETGSDLDMAAVLVQNRVAVAQAMLPEDVRRTGVTTKKRSPSFAMALNLTSPNGEYDSVYLSNFATLRIRDELSRVTGVGEVQILGVGDYSMRIWLDPEKLKARGLTTNDIADAIREQNVQVAAGVIGQPPAPKGQSFQFTVNVEGRLQDAKQFEDIIVKVGPDGRLTRVRDVARVELGAISYGVESQVNGQPSAGIFVYQLPGANLLELSANVKAVLERLKPTFPEGLEYLIMYDASFVVEVSIEEIVTTLLIAAFLVILTVYIFLQDWRATLIPALTIPVSLIGTFLVMSLLGFSVNTLTLFGLVLAIGIVVDDAIVVVENVSRNIAESGLSAKEATIKSMEEVTGPVVATTLVLLAVFIPTAFMGGITGILFQQFALTIAATTVFSSINALTLSPALCALLLRPPKERHHGLFRWFNVAMDRGTTRYMGVVAQTMKRRVFAVMAFLAIGVLVYFGIAATPGGFVPDEDQGLLMVNVQLPDAASLQRTRVVVNQVNDILSKTPGVESYMALSGYSILNGSMASNMGAGVVVLDPWSERTDPEKSLQGIMMHLRREFAKIGEAVVVVFPAPSLPGLGMAGGFDMMLQDRSGVGLSTLQRVAERVAQQGNADPVLQGLFTSFRADVPQLFAQVDRTKVKSMDLPLSSVFSTMQTYMGSSYVNDFNKFGRTYRVMLQADSKFRAQPDSLLSLEVRNRKGEMLPLSTLLSVEKITGPEIITRYNMYPAASIKGGAAPGFSSGQALEAMNDMAENSMPQGMGYEWTGLSWQQTAAAGTGSAIFLLAVVFVYLVLAAQYESWKIPAPVILSVPLAMLGAFGAILLRGLDNNIYTQIGLVLLVGLSAKNAILIVEFAKARHEKGLKAVDAAMEAARLRFRPILMTAFSFILGVVPLVVASGAGAGARQALGTTVFGGMLAATILGVVFVPLLYTVFQQMGFSKKGSPKDSGP